MDALYPERNAEIVRRVQAGESRRDVANAIGITKNAVMGVLWRSKLDLPAPRLKLSQDQAREIRARWSEKARVLAAEYGVSIWTIRAVRRRQIWRDAS